MLRLLLVVVLALAAGAEEPWLVWEVTAGGLSRSVTAVGDWSSAEDDRHVVETRLRLKGVTSVWRGLGPDEGRIALALIENPAIGPLVRKELGSVERVTLLDR